MTLKEYKLNFYCQFKQVKVEKDIELIIESISNSVKFQ